MKKILLVPIKNEAWILETFLNNVSKNFDAIIVADQDSTDSSVEICKKYQNVTVIQNTEKIHSNKVRWLLLDTARKLFGTDNIIFCLDADETLPANFFAQNIEQILEPGQSFSLRWIQIWKSPNQYRTDWPWKNNWKTIAFRDDGKVDYQREEVINDHTGRIPFCKKDIRIKDSVLLHWQFLNLKQAQTKQAWYMCHEFIRKSDALKINLKYSDTILPIIKTLRPTKKEWLEGIEIPKNNYEANNDTKISEINSMFDAKKPAFFESLIIWDIPELKNIFKQREGRVPHKYKKYILLTIGYNCLRKIYGSIFK